MTRKLNWEKANQRDVGIASHDDQRWFSVTSRFDFFCETCGEKHLAGERAFYNRDRPARKKMRCPACNGS